VLASCSFASPSLSHGLLLNAINNLDSPRTPLRNVVQSANHPIGFRLLGGPKSPRDAVGAKIFLTSAGLRQRADLVSGAKEEIDVPETDRFVMVRGREGLAKD
jgi:hypothetical protein